MFQFPSGDKGVFISGVALAICWCLLTGAGWKETGNSQGYRYETEFMSMIGSYPDFEAPFSKKNSFPIPGLERTMLNQGICTQMVPQGICSAGDYILLSAYDGSTNEAIYPSVIYVLSLKQKTLITVLELPDQTHAGGLAFDGTYVWIAKGKEKACSAISYDIIDKAARSGHVCVKLDEYTATVDCGIRASYLSYFRGQLWIGTCTEKATDGNLRRFAITADREGNLLLLQTAQIRVPGHANGLTFAQVNDTLCMAVNCSWSRYLSSKIYLYEVTEQGNALVFKKHGHKKFPPMLEESFTDGNYVYVVFESAATRYSTLFYHKCIMPVDRVCALDVETLFDFAR